MVKLDLGQAGQQRGASGAGIGRLGDRPHHRHPVFNAQLALGEEVPGQLPRGLASFLDAVRDLLPQGSQRRRMRNGGLSQNGFGLLEPF